MPTNTSDSIIKVLAGGKPDKPTRSGAGNATLGQILPMVASALAGSGEGTTTGSGPVQASGSATGSGSGVSLQDLIAGIGPILASGTATAGAGASQPSTVSPAAGPEGSTPVTRAADGTAGTPVTRAADGTAGTPVTPVVAPPAPGTPSLVPPTPPDLSLAPTAPQRDIGVETQGRIAAANQSGLVPAIAALIGGGAPGTSAGRLAAAVGGYDARQDANFQEQQQNYEGQRQQNETDAERAARLYQEQLGGYQAQTMAGYRQAGLDIKNRDIASKAGARHDAAYDRGLKIVAGLNGTVEDRAAYLQTLRDTQPQIYGDLGDDDIQNIALLRTRADDIKQQGADASTARAAATTARVKTYDEWVKDQRTNHQAQNELGRDKLAQDDSHFGYLMGYRYHQLSQSGDQFDQRMALAIDKAKGLYKTDSTGGANPSLRELTSQLARLGKLDDNIRQYAKEADTILAKESDPNDRTPGQQQVIGHANVSVQAMNEERNSVLARIEELEGNISNPPAPATPTRSQGPLRVRVIPGASASGPLPTITFPSPSGMGQGNAPNRRAVPISKSRQKAASAVANPAAAKKATGTPQAGRDEWLSRGYALGVPKG